VLASFFVAVSAAIVFSLGFGHLLLTFFSRAFSPRDAALEARLKTVSPLLTRRTTMWRSQIGFHASHSMGAMLFGAVYGYLAIVHDSFLFQSYFLVALGALVLLSYLLLARLYWFIVPLSGIALATASYAAGLAAAYG